MSTRAGALALAIGAVALAVSWRLAPPVSPPIYDGCITESYRFLGHNPPPTGASQSYPAGSNFQPAEVITGESPAQAQILMMAGTFVASAPFSVAISPITAPAAPPPGQSFDGNVYRIVATASGGRLLQPQPQVPVTIVLRATSSSGPSRAILRLQGTTWVAPSKTFSAGCGDEFEAVSSKLGVFAIVQTGRAPATGGGFPTLVLIPIIAAVLLVAVLLLLRLDRSFRA